MLTFDRDPRWVGSASGRDFPSALRRFLLCLGIEPQICPPQRPDKNAFVERYHRSYNQECLQIHRPGTLQEVCEVTERFVLHYNHERPHQGRTCQNQPPRVAFPSLPPLPPVPQTVNPDRWLQSIHGQAFARRIGSDGCVEVDREPYYIKQASSRPGSGSLCERSREALRGVARGNAHQAASEAQDESRRSNRHDDRCVRMARRVHAGGSADPIDQGWLAPHADPEIPAGRSHGREGQDWTRHRFTYRLWLAGYCGAR